MLQRMPRDHPTTIASPQHQRADGAFELRFGPQGRLRHLFQQAPLRVLFPTPEPGEPPVAAVVNCAGGLAGGDALRQEVEVEAAGRATVSTAAAEKVYRSLGATDTRIATRLALGSGAVLEWIPQETILFDGARLERRLRAALAEDAVLLAAETLVFGRAARGERMRSGALLDAWRIHGPDGLLWADALALPDDPGEALGAPFGFNDAEALGTVLLAGPGAEAGRDLLRASVSAAPGGATVPRPGLLIARWLGAAAAVRASVGGAIVALRAGLLGLPPRLPRLWTT
jgi:urease accessory protein